MNLQVVLRMIATLAVLGAVLLALGDLLPGLREHPGIGFVLVRSHEHGAVVLGAAGEHRLATGEVLGDDPLAPFGPHGGLGGPQAHPFVLAPADLPWPDEAVVGAEAVHHVLRGWLARLGHEAYAEAVKV